MCFSPLCVSCADWVKFSTMTMQFFANRWKNHWVQRGCFPPQYLIINFTKEKTLMSIKFLISHVFYWRLCVRCFVLVKTPYQVHAKKILTNLRSSICKRLMELAVRNSFRVLKRPSRRQICLEMLIFVKGIESSLEEILLSVL
jgi:hypothetical protein